MSPKEFILYVLSIIFVTAWELALAYNSRAISKYYVEKGTIFSKTGQVGQGTLHFLEQILPLIGVCSPSPTPYTRPDYLVPLVQCARPKEIGTLNRVAHFVSNCYLFQNYRTWRSIGSDCCLGCGRWGSWERQVGKSVTQYCGLSTKPYNRYDDSG